MGQQGGPVPDVELGRARVEGDPAAAGEPFPALAAGAERAPKRLLGPCESAPKQRRIGGDGGRGRAVAAAACARTAAPRRTDGGGSKQAAGSCRSIRNVHQGSASSAASVAGRARQRLSATSSCTITSTAGQRRAGSANSRRSSSLAIANGRLATTRNGSLRQRQRQHVGLDHLDPAAPGSGGEAPPPAPGRARSPARARRRRPAARSAGRCRRRRRPPARPAPGMPPPPPPRPPEGAGSAGR